MIVVDDGSTDDTRAAVARYGSRVCYLHQANQGAAGARNRGLAEASGRFVAFLDSDDLWLPGKLALELELLARFPEADAVISDSEFYHEGALVAGSSSRHIRISSRSSPGPTRSAPGIRPTSRNPRPA